MGGAEARCFFKGQEDVAFGFRIFVFLEEAGESVMDFSAICGAEFQDGLKGADCFEVFTVKLI